MSLMIFVPVYTQAQTNNQFSSEDLRLIDKAVAERDSLKQINGELQKQLDIWMQESSSNHIQYELEHNYVLETKKLLLSSYQAIQTYRDHKRPLIVKILTVGIVRDYHDKDIGKKITDLQKEIMEWK